MGPRIDKIILKKEEQSWRTHTAWFQNLLQSYSTQDCDTDIRKDRAQWKRTQSLETNSHVYSQLIFNKDETTQWGKEWLFHWIFTCRRIKVDT